MEKDKSEIKDGITHIFGYPCMDVFHDYPGTYSNARYYHYLKSSICIPFLVTHANREKTFLDAGAGRGPYTYIAKDLYKKTYCFEFDEHELDAARKNIKEHENIIFKQVDLTDIPLESQSIDIAICSEVLEHIPDIQKAVNELYRVLKPGGKILISMPNKNSLFYKNVRRKLRDLRAKPQNQYTHTEWEAIRHISFNSKDIESYITSAGLNILERFGCNVLPLPTAVRTFCIKYPFAMYIAKKVHGGIGAMIPKYGSFYFVTAQK